MLAGPLPVEVLVPVASVVRRVSPWMFGRLYCFPAFPVCWGLIVRFTPPGSWMVFSVMAQLPLLASLCSKKPRYSRVGAPITLI